MCGGGAGQQDLGVCVGQGVFNRSGRVFAEGI